MDGAPGLLEAVRAFLFRDADGLPAYGIIAGIFGWLAFRSRIKGVYFSILTQALTYAGALIFFRNNTLMGGNNGFTDFKTELGFSFASRPRSAGSSSRQQSCSSGW